ncbi:MAG: lipopolysaccharide biosynthesis protein [Thermoguttaceae bacterium]
MTSNDSDHNKQQGRHLRRLLGGTGIALAEFVLGVGIAIFLTPYIAGTLGDRLYGIFSVAAAFVSCFSILDLGIAAAVARFITLHHSRGENKECSILAANAFFLYLGLGFLGLLASFTIAAGMYWVAPAMEDINLFAATIVIFGLSFLIGLPTNALTGVVIGTINQHLSASRNFFFRFVGAFVSFFTIWNGGGIVALALVSAIMSVFNALAIYWLARRCLPELALAPSVLDKNHVRNLLTYGVFASISQMGNVMLIQTDAIILAFYVSFSVTTPYRIVIANLADYFTNLMWSLFNWSTTWMTHLHTRGDREGLLSTFRFAHKSAVYIATFIAFGLIAWGEPFLQRWIGREHPEWVDAYPALAVTVVYIWLLRSQTPNINYLYAVAKHRYYAYLNVGEAAIKLVLTCLFVTHTSWVTQFIDPTSFTLCGRHVVNHVFADTLFVAAVATFLPGIVGRGILFPLITCRLLSYSLIRYYTAWFCNVACALISLIVPALISYRFLAPTYPSLFLCGILSVLSYGVVVILVGFRSDERRRILARLRK